MEFDHVTSSQIHSMAHDKQQSTMTVRFHCRCKSGDANCPKCGGTGIGSSYEYPNVSEHTYSAIRHADSVGTAFHREIRSHPDKHPHTKL